MSKIDRGVFIFIGLGIWLSVFMDYQRHEFNYDVNKLDQKFTHDILLKMYGNLVRIEKNTDI